MIHSTDFGSGCVRVLQGKTARLTRAEKAALRPCANGAPPGPPADGEDEGFFVERLEKRRKLAVDEQQYACSAVFHPPRTWWRGSLAWPESRLASSATACTQ
ncbi:hypothetical protein PI125_g10099 [Phytophthora idaei]|nr:hypothetical protein PI125_g10099 [Phytophthora idaei]